MKMDENKKIIIEKMVTYENGLISEEHDFNEDTLSEWVLEACEFAFDNFYISLLIFSFLIYSFYFSNTSIIEEFHF